MRNGAKSKMGFWAQYARKVSSPTPGTAPPPPPYAVPQSWAPPRGGYGVTTPPSAGVPSEPETSTSFLEAVWSWKGNPKGGAAEKSRCPHCDSPRFFSRTNMESGGHMSMSMAPAPMCADCGYPLLQGGSGAVAALKPGESVHAARSPSYTFIS